MKTSVQNPNFHESWPAAERALCLRAIERHGGWQAWENLQAIKIKPLWLKGLVPWLKGYPHTFTLPAHFEIFPKERRAIFHEFPQAHQYGELSRGSIKIGDSQGNSVSDIHHAREKYKGLVKLAPWQPLDALYFFGYAWVTYLSVPFVLPELRFVGSFQHRDRAELPEQKQELWEALTVEFPADFDSHCRQQTFYFDSSGLLKRHDYYAEIVGRWAMGAHYSQDYHLSQGLQIALRRRVYTRFGTLALPLTALAADLVLL